MRILHVIPSLAARYGGPITVVKGLTKHLVKRGHHVTLLTTNIDGDGVLEVPLNQPVEMDGVEVIYYPVGKPRGYIFSWPLWKALRDRVDNFDIVHLHSIFQWPTTAAAFWCRKRRVPYIVHAIGSLDTISMKKSFAPAHTAITSLVKKSIYMNTIGKFDINHANALQFTSSADLKASREMGIQTPGYILPHGIDLPTKPVPNPESIGQRFPQIKGRKIVLFLGRLDPIKGIDILTQAISKLSHEREDFVLVLAGNGSSDYVNDIDAMIRNHDISDFVTMVGSVYEKDKSMLLTNAEIFVLPSYHENFPIAVLEAMASGLPVVISNRTKINDKVSDAGAGIVTTLDPNNVADAIDRLLSEESLRNQMGANGNRLVREELSWENSTELVIQAYLDIISGSNNAIRSPT